MGDDFEDGQINTDKWTIDAGVWNEQNGVITTDGGGSTLIFRYPYPMTDGVGYFFAETELSAYGTNLNDGVEFIIGNYKVKFVVGELSAPPYPSIKTTTHLMELYDGDNIVGRIIAHPNNVIFCYSSDYYFRVCATLFGCLTAAADSPSETSFRIKVTDTNSSAISIKDVYYLKADEDCIDCGGNYDCMACAIGSVSPRFQVVLDGIKNHTSDAIYSTDCALSSLFNFIFDPSTGPPITSDSIIYSNSSFTYTLKLSTVGGPYNAYCNQNELSINGDYDITPPPFPDIRQTKYTLIYFDENGNIGTTDSTFYGMDGLVFGDAPTHRIDIAIIESSNSLYSKYVSIYYTTSSQSILCNSCDNCDVVNGTYILNMNTTCDYIYSKLGDEDVPCPTGDVSKQERYIQLSISENGGVSELSSHMDIDVKISSILITCIYMYGLRSTGGSEKSVYDEIYYNLSFKRELRSDYGFVDFDSISLTYDHENTSVTLNTPLTYYYGKKKYTIPPCIFDYYDSVVYPVNLQGIGVKNGALVFADSSDIPLVMFYADKPVEPVNLLNRVEFTHNGNGVYAYGSTSLDTNTRLYTFSKNVANPIIYFIDNQEYIYNYDIVGYVPQANFMEDTVWKVVLTSDNSLSITPENAMANGILLSDITETQTITQTNAISTLQVTLPGIYSNVNNCQYSVIDASGAYYLVATPSTELYLLDDGIEVKVSYEQIIKIFDKCKQNISNKKVGYDINGILSLNPYWDIYSFSCVSGVMTTSADIRQVATGVNGVIGIISKDFDESTQNFTVNGHLHVYPPANPRYEVDNPTINISVADILTKTLWFDATYHYNWINIYFDNESIKYTSSLYNIYPNNTIPISQFKYSTEMSKVDKNFHLFLDPLDCKSLSDYELTLNNVYTPLNSYWVPTNNFLRCDNSSITCKITALS